MSGIGGPHQYISASYHCTCKTVSKYKNFLLLKILTTLEFQFLFCYTENVVSIHFLSFD